MKIVSENQLPKPYEASLIYNANDSHYYIYVGEDYFCDTGDLEQAKEQFLKAIDEADWLTALSS